MTALFRKMTIESEYGTNGETPKQSRQNLLKNKVMLTVFFDGIFSDVSFMWSYSQEEARFLDIFLVFASR